MQKITIQLFTNEEGPKLFYSDYKRIQMHECSKVEFSKFAKDLEEDFDKQGLYILVGEDEKGEKLVYIGESDSLKSRLTQHFNDPTKDYVERIVIITSKDSTNDFSKTEMHYLEKKLIEKFDTSKYNVKNGNSGQGKKPGPIERMSLDEELTLIHTGLDSFGISLEKDDVTTTKDNYQFIDSARTDINVVNTVPNLKTEVFGIFHPNNKLTILAGQSFSNKAKTNEGDLYCVRNTLKKAKTIDGIEIEGDENGYTVKYIKNVTYNAPSTASNLIKGGTSNGWVDWKLKDNPKEVIKQYMNK